MIRWIIYTDNVHKSSYQGKHSLDVERVYNMYFHEEKNLLYVEQVNS